MSSDDSWSNEASPSSSSWVPPTSGPLPGEEAKLRSIDGLSTALKALLWVGVGLTALTLVDAVASLRWLQNKDPNGLDYWYEHPDAWALFSGALALAVTGVLIATVVVWLVWQHRATRNVVVLGGVTRRGTGWSIGAWFVPIINLWWPAQNVHDLCRLSKPGLPRGARPERQPEEPLIGWWWAAWLTSNVASQISGRLYFEANINSEWASAFTADLVALPLSAASAVLAVLVVSKIAQGQRLRLAPPQPPSSSNPGLNL